MLLVFTLLPLVLVNVFSIRQSSNALTNAISSDYEVASRTRANRISEIFIDQVRLLELLSANDRLVPAVRAANSNYPSNSATARINVEGTEKDWLAASDDDFLVQQYVDGPIADDLRRFMSLVPGMIDVFFTDKYGALVASTRRMQHFDMYHEEWWQSAWNDDNGAIYIKVGQLDRPEEGQGIILAIPILSSTTNQPIGVLRASYSFVMVQNILSQYAAPDLPDTLVVDHNNKILASTNAALIGKQGPVATENVSSDVAYGKNTLQDNGDELFFAESKLPTIPDVPAISELGWRVITVQERSVAFASVMAQITSALLTGVVVLLTALGAAFFFGSRLSAPLMQLASLAQAGDLGKIAARVSQGGRDEIELLGQSLQDFARRLLRSQEDIAAINRGLEQTVEERTVELRQMVGEQEELLSTQKQLLAQIADMSIPVLPVVKGVVVIPLIGSIDSSRASLLADRLLEGVELEQARVILLDITGVPIVDSQVAAALLQAIHAARLLGAHTILVGVRPEIAQALVSLGIDLGDVKTTASLQEGLRRAQALVQRKTILA